MKNRLCVATVCLLTGAAWSQTELATLTGTVTDSTGAILRNVTVSATNEATNVSASTISTETGRYLLPACARVYTARRLGRR
jgi:hypothetical protein